MAVTKQNCGCFSLNPPLVSILMDEDIKIINDIKAMSSDNHSKLKSGSEQVCLIMLNQEATGSTSSELISMEVAPRQLMLR